jgi:hypothetical protein
LGQKEIKMTYNIIISGTTKIADFTIGDTCINTAQDALEYLMHLRYEEGIDHLIIGIDNLAPQFFDLKSGLAGDILQKFSNYDGYLAVVGDFSTYESNSLRDFIRESNRQGRVLFVPDIIEATERLGS